MVETGRWVVETESQRTCADDGSRAFGGRVYRTIALAVTGTHTPSHTVRCLDHDTAGDCIGRTQERERWFRKTALKDRDAADATHMVGDPR